jgi:hypothetical protein
MNVECSPNYCFSDLSMQQLVRMFVFDLQHLLSVFHPC